MTFDNTLKDYMQLYLSEEGLQCDGKGDLEVDFAYKDGNTGVGTKSSTVTMEDGGIVGGAASKDTIVVLVALYRYENVTIRSLHSLLEDIDGIKPYTIFYQDYGTNTFNLPTVAEEELFVKQIINLAPSIVGISVLSPYVPIAKRLTKLIRDNSSSLVIWGGTHPTISPESCIKETDIICVGEGEGAISDLVRHIRDGKDYMDIKNLWINNGTEIIKNQMRSLLQDLDSLPFPSYGNNSFFFINSNKMTRDDPALLSKTITIQSSRGCPYVCSYCVNSLLRSKFKDLGNFTRTRSVNSIIKEIKELIPRFKNTKLVFFEDEGFATDIQWLDEFESRYKNEIGLPFGVEYNPMEIKKDPEILNKLHRSGLHTVEFGIQSGSDHIRNHIFHRRGKNKELIDLANEMAGYGININYHLILDNPYETEESLVTTINLLLQLPKPLNFTLYSLQYFPDYPLTRTAILDKHIKAEDASVDTLLERTSRGFLFKPKLLPKNRKEKIQNIIWLITKKRPSDRTIKYILFKDSLFSKLYFYYLNFVQFHSIHLRESPLFPYLFRIYTLYTWLFCYRKHRDYRL